MEAENTVTPEYLAFLASKAPRPVASGIEPSPMPAHLFDYQAAATAFCVRQGRAALFLDCLGGESTILTVDGPRRIDELVDIDRHVSVFSVNQDGEIVPSRAMRPFRKGRAALYRVETKAGRIIIATRGHRILTQSGWTAVSDLSVGDRLPGYEQAPLGSNSARDPSALRPGARHFVRKHEDYLGDYSSCLRQCDPRLLPSSNTYQGSIQPQACACGRTDACLRWDGQVSGQEGIPFHRYARLPSTQGSDLLGMNAAEAQQCQLLPSGLISSACCIHIERPASSMTIRPQSVGGLHPSEFQSFAVVPSTSPDTIASVHYIRFDDFYDTHVPGYENYLGDGFISHNTGLGKTVCELEFGKQMAAASNGWALILTPLAVARQIEAEGRRFGYDCRVIREMADTGPGINICNYDRLDKLDASAFGVVVLDESSILKSFTGATTRALIQTFADHAFKLCATATPAPNDHMELGQHAEFLGIMASNEMLARWFISDQTEMGRYRLKRHGERAFWDWLATWSRCASGPEDLGFDGSRFVLPPLKIIRHKVAGDVRAPVGALFMEDLSATNIHTIKRQTSAARAEFVASLVAAEPDHSWLVWVDSDYEADAVMKNLPNAIDVRGSQSPERKEDGLSAFLTSGRPLVTKPSIAGQGLNYQHCDRSAYTGRSFSYEQWYQSVRRFWRFGQKNEVHVHLAVAEGEEQIGRVIDRKASDHQAMKHSMAGAMARTRVLSSKVKVSYDPRHIGRLPSWLKSGE